MTVEGVQINYMPGRLTAWRGDATSGLTVLVLLLAITHVVVRICSVLASPPILNAVQLPIVRAAIVLAGLAELVLVTDSLMRTMIGVIAEATLDALVNHIPELRIVYNTSKMGIEMVTDGAGHLRTPVRVETRSRMYMTGFKTGNRASDGRDVVFIPAAPNITTGFVVELKTENVTRLDGSTEDALI